MPSYTLDSLFFVSYGGYDWKGQKVYWDDIELMGYADYDVGVKEILSPGSAGSFESSEESPYGYSSSSYEPVARIKNFGREPADFAVVAEILQGETQVYYDSFDWSLPADTDDTVSFNTFDPPDTGAYILHIYTVMDEPPAIDESDADDEKNRELYFIAITEPVTPITLLDLKVNPICPGDVQIQYSLPNGHEGTLTLLDASGRCVDAKQVKGYGTVKFSTDQSSGVYFIKLEAGGSAMSRKIILIE
ncbi:T9SS type A sorting domain-containing protein [candidate division WOR-3 bacterium]|uniref:T9SS type A sorting domain-containing protein n=1 Tax=candidate division WOR-3 bacterium TaxID=2052148 RepID=A0A9D5QC42_UNCW3|nr:T9SS type A sorting domain-containing protein [candidate division WOR-3 bacterium]MBD3363626.1 T9SS type A sorting domain-containing protein [candidate division WOR-3 bacterium]